MSKVMISAAGNASQTPVTPKSLDNKNAIAEIDTIPLDNAITEDSTPFPLGLQKADRMIKVSAIYKATKYRWRCALT